MGLKYWKAWLVTLFVTESKIKNVMAFSSSSLVTSISRSRYFSFMHSDHQSNNEFMSSTTDIIFPEQYKDKECQFILHKNVKSKKFGLFGRKSRTVALEFDYKYDELEILGNRSTATSNSTIGIILIHPIGVGIGKWFYDRLLSALWNYTTTQTDLHLKVIVPDLLGSGSACNPALKANNHRLRHLPLLNISDWSDQILDLMCKTQQDTNIHTWCIVANGGCSPIALEVAQKSTHHSPPLKISDIILSSVPKLPFFLQSSNPNKVSKSYKTLCGIPGNLFWWYSCRNKGSFIQKFSEKNLVADAKNLGPKWRSNCFKTATMNNGKSKYSTFAFLAGALQDGCIHSLESFKNSTNIQIHLIKGLDKRRNRAKSWFWQNKSKLKKGAIIEPQQDQTSSDLLSDFLKDNGIRGKEATVDGRISLAHEDAVGYCKAMLRFIGSNISTTLL